MMNKGINAIKMATVILVIGHAMNNNKPERMESRRG
jgi:hypothetical protein